MARGYGDDKDGWAPMPPGGQPGSRDLTPLGDVSSQAPQPYDPSLLPPAETGQVFDRAAAHSGPPAHVGHAPVEAQTRQEIEQAVATALTRKGIGGKVVVVGSNAELHGAAKGVVSINLGDWPQQWNLLPADIRERRAEAAAVRMRNALDDIVGRKRSGAPIGPLLGKIAGVVAVVGVAVGLVWWLSQSGFFGDRGSASAAPTTGPVPLDSSPAGVVARHERACEAARSRLYSGAAMGVDLDGWVVELWLSRGGEPGGLKDEAAVKDIAENGSTMIGAKLAGKSEALTDGALVGDSVIVRLTEGFVPPFFDSDGRNKLADLAQRTAMAVKAEHGALYARCGHLPIRDVGAWYFGADRPKASVALLYAAGAFAEPANVDVAKHGGAKVLASLATSIAKLGPKELDDALRLDGGRWVPMDEANKDGATAIRFPLGGPTRASQVARKLAQQLGL